MAAPPQSQVPPPQPQAPPQPPLMGQVGPSGAAGQQVAAGAPPLAAGPGPSGMQMAAQAQDFDPVQRFRLLLPQLKESLQVRGTPGPIRHSSPRLASPRPASPTEPPPLYVCVCVYK